MGEGPTPAKDKKTPPTDVLPEDFRTLEEFSEFWDTHSTADYEEVMEPVEVEIDLASSKIYCPAAKDLLVQIRQQARKQGVSTETLINLWLQEKLRASAQVAEEGRGSGAYHAPFSFDGRASEAKGCCE